MSKVPRVLQRLSAVSFLDVFDSKCGEISKGAQEFSRGCYELYTSDKMKRMLQVLWPIQLCPV